MKWKISRLLAGSRAKAAALLVVMALVLIAAFTLTDQEFGLESRERSREAATIAFDATIGATVEPLDRATAQSLGIPPQDRGLVVTSLGRDGPAARAGVRAGDVIERVARARIDSLDDATAALNEARGAQIPLMLNRHGRYVIAQLPIHSTADRAGRDLPKQGSER